MTDFGEKPKTAAGEKPDETRNDHLQAKTSTPIAQTSPPVRREREKQFLVDEDREIAVTVLYSTVIFRPNQMLLEERDKRLIDIARDNGIRLRIRK